MGVVEDGVSKGMRAVQIHKEHTKGAAPLRTIQRYAKAHELGKAVNVERAPGGGRKAENRPLVGAIQAKGNLDGATVTSNARNIARELQAACLQVRFVCAEEPKKRRQGERRARDPGKRGPTVFSKYAVGRYGQK